MQEERLVHRWTNTKDMRHPGLHHIALWSLSQDGLGYLSLWDMQGRGGAWMQTTALTGCSGTGEELEAMFS